MLPKGVLFDFDGVVVDSFQVHYKAWRSAFLELFKKEIVPFPHQTHAGKSPRIIAAYFCEQIGQSGRSVELYLLKGKYLHDGLTPPKLLPGVREVQGFLAENNKPYGIASNATKQFLANSIKQLNIEFEVFFGVEDYEFPKPHPEAYLSLAKYLGFKEEDYASLWVFEDSLTGTEAAKSAGMIPIGILTQYTENELKEAGSQLVFPTLLEAFYYLKAEG